MSSIPFQRTGGRRRRTAPAEDAATRTTWYGLLAFLFLCLLGGGSNLPTALPLTVIRPAGILLIAAVLAMPERSRDHRLHLPILLLGAFTLCIALQLVPLPPALWASLPGRAEIARQLVVTGQEVVWRPLSLTPAITLNSLLATLTGWAVILAYRRLPVRRRAGLVGVVIAMAVASCAVGLLQVMGGTGSPFYFYKTDGSISGLMANRNHQAAWLAMTLPLLRVWAVRATEETRLRRTLIAALLALLVLGSLLLTGSRSGLLLGAVGLLAALLIAPRRAPVATRPRSVRVLLRWAPLVAPVLLVLLTIWAGRDMSIQRLFTADYSGELRVQALPTILSLVRTYFPFGSGFGSFDTVFRMHEPDALLKATFFNRAHDDYLELAITGGILPLIVFAIVVGWAASRAVAACRRSWRDEGVLEARAGAIGLAILMLASLSDYPVRAPLMSAVATIAVCWLAGMGRPDAPVSASGRPASSDR